MKTIKIALAVALPVVVALLAALFACSLIIKTQDDLGGAIGAFLMFLVNICSNFACLPFAAAILLFEILLFTVKNQRRLSIALVIFMSIFLPVLAFVVIFDLSAYSFYSTLFEVVVGVLALAYLAAYALSIIYLAACRKDRAEETA